MEIWVTDKNDIPAICAIDRLASRPDHRRFIEQSVEGGTAHVAVIDGRVAGYIVLEYTFFASGYISMLIVREAYWRHGIGSAPVRHAEGLCATEKLFTSTNERNRPMQTLLVKLGYSPSGVINNIDEGNPEIVYFKRGEKIYFDRDEY